MCTSRRGATIEARRLLIFPVVVQVRRSLRRGILTDMERDEIMKAVDELDKPLPPSSAEPRPKPGDAETTDAKPLENDDEPEWDPLDTPPTPMP